MAHRDKIHIAFASDDNYSRYLGVCIASILISAESNDSFAFYVIDNGISEQNKKRLAELQTFRPHELFFLKPDVERFQRLPKCLYWGINTYLRLLLPEELPELDRILYLDCDMVVTDSLRELWREDLCGKAAGVVENYDDRTRGKERCAPRLGLDFYFNAGMLLLDLKRIREKKLFSEVFQWCASNTDNLKFPDQDGLNLVLKDEIVKLPSRWNIQINPYVQIEELEDEEKRARVRECRGIVHFITSLKPDAYEFPPSRPKKVFLDVVDKTSWRDCLEKPTLKKRWKKFKNSSPIYRKFRNIERKIKAGLKTGKIYHINKIEKRGAKEEE